MLTVRIETPGNKTRNALAAAVVLDLPGGRTRRILTDTSWRWSPARSTSGTRAAQLHSVALTEEYYPSGAQWITEPDGRLADVYWTTFAKTLPRGVCAEVVSGPSQIPGVVSASCPSGDSKWGIIVAAVLGVLSLLALVAAGAALFMLRRMRRRLPPDEKRDNGAEELTATKLDMVEGGVGVRGSDGRSDGGSRDGGSSGSNGGGNSKDGSDGRGRGEAAHAHSDPPSRSFSSTGQGPPTLPPPARPMEKSPWPPTSSMNTPTAPPAPSPPSHGQQLSDREAAAANAAATTVVRRATAEQASAAAAQRPGDFSNEIGSTISSAGRPPHGGYTAAHAADFPPPPPMPMSLLSPQVSVTGLDFAGNASGGR